MTDKRWHVYIDTNLGEGEAEKLGSGTPWVVTMPTGTWEFEGSIEKLKREVVKFCKSTDGYTHCFGVKLPRRDAIKLNRVVS